MAGAAAFAVGVLMIVLRTSLCVVMIAAFSVRVGVFRMRVLMAMFGVIMRAAFAMDMLLGYLLFLCVLVFVLMIAAFCVRVGVFRMCVLMAVFGVIVRAAFAVDMLLGRLLFFGVLVFVLMVAIFSVYVSVFFGDGGIAPCEGGKEKGGNFQKMFLVHGCLLGG